MRACTLFGLGEKNCDQPGLPHVFGDPITRDPGLLKEGVVQTMNIISVCEEHSGMASRTLNARRITEEEAMVIEVMNQ